MTEREIIAKEWRDENGILHRREVGQELVRCKECKHWWETEGTNYGDCNQFKVDTIADDFCSYGERKETVITTDCSWK